MKEIIPGLWDIDEIGNIVHCYLWQWDQGITLIDTGMPGNADNIMAALGKAGFRSRDLRRIIITHADSDHCGSLPGLKRVIGAPVACHAVEKHLLENPGQRKPARTVAGYAMRPLFALLSRLPQYRARPVTPDELVVDGQKLPEGFTVIHTPGHTPGHIALLHAGRRLLITGDALTNRGGRLGGPAAVFTPDPENARRSIWKLGKKYGDDFDVAVFGHGPPMLDNAGRQVGAFADRLFEVGNQPDRLQEVE